MAPLELWDWDGGELSQPPKVVTLKPRPARTGHRNSPALQDAPNPPLPPIAKIKIVRPVDNLDFSRDGVATTGRPDTATTTTARPSTTTTSPVDGTSRSEGQSVFVASQPANPADLDHDVSRLASFDAEESRKEGKLNDLVPGGASLKSGSGPGL